MVRKNKAFYTGRLTMLALLAILFAPEAALGSEDLKSIRRGNRFFNDGNFSGAELEYRRSLESSRPDPRALFNLGNALYRQERFDEAAGIFESLSGTQTDPDRRADAFHNLGNALLQQQKFPESIEAYKNALRLRPGDEDTRHNLAYAMRLLQDPPPQDQQGQGDDQNDSDDKGNEDQNNRQQGQPQNQESRQQPPADRISPQDAARILDAMNQKEQQVQEKINRNEAGQRARAEREW